MDKNSEIQRQYFTHLAESETTRLRGLMEPFLERQDVGDGELFEQLARILGEFGARINVIEQAAELQLLVENPLQSAPLLHGEINLGIQDLDPTGFHHTETLGDGTILRWTEVPEFTVTLAAYRPCPKTLRIYFHEIIKPEYGKSLRIYVDGQESRHRVRKIGGQRCLECRLQPAADLALTNVTVKLPAVHTPSDLGPSDDRRELGIAITRITVDQSPSSLIARILNR